MRYFLELAYRGGQYCGWQRQPNAPSVQERMEEALRTILREPVEVVGCGRTDTGVHARYYVAHFDAENDLPPRLLDGLNSILPNDIAVYSCRAVAAEAHARYDAFERSYTYTISLRKDPFLLETAWFYPQWRKIDTEAMQAMARLLLQYDQFFPFCKTDSSADHYACQMMRAEWEFQENQWRFHIHANRFLRGMVRLIVGACVQVGAGKISLEQIQYALDTQTALKGSLSAPPQGLALTGVRYKDNFAE
ncbi:MAG: tRNA pseudouridine(38-40) synthase TruA [Chitinophagales bacterium]|nr:tRNA pseudouridine(38-40) synthase TruA [Chitinophagales bacterium]